MLSRLALWLSALLLIGACATGAAETTVSTASGTEEQPSVTISGGPTGLFASELIEFDSCEAFLAHIKAEALERVGPYGFNTEQPFIQEMTIMDGAEAAADSSGSSVSSQPAAAVDYSRTNVQEVGVDEPDLIKTDGSRILAVGSRALHYIDISSGTPDLVSSLALTTWEGVELWDHQILVSGDVALLLAHGYGTNDRIGEVSLAARIDLSDPEEMSVIDTLVIEAGFVSARMVGEKVALVVRAQPSISYEFVYPSSSSRSAEQRAEEINRMIVEESTAQDWAPRYRLSGGMSEEVTQGSLIDCSSGYAPQEFSGFNTLSVLTFDLPQAIDPSQVATIMAGGDIVYATADRLYVAGHRWIDWNNFDDEDIATVKTSIHRFDISGPAKPVYEASGSVDGFLLNQFAMSEHEGYLRVASTDTPGWWWREGTSESRVDVLERDGRELRTVGSATGLGKGEQIFAVRFMGEIGYVVTFRQTDPLYTIDLSDPTAPEVTGELKILGYSAYLHPIGDGLLLGVGQDADAEGRIRGTQVSVFDVSDLTNPERIHQYSFSEFTSSEAEFNHHAFLYWPPTGMAVIPIRWTDRRGGESDWVNHSAAAVLEAGPVGVEEVGRIAHELDPRFDYEKIFGYDLYRYESSVPITRSLVVGDTLFTLSWLGLKASDLESLAETSWIAFPPDRWIEG